MSVDVFQNALLDFLTAQLVAHGAEIFAASLAYLTFVNIFLKPTIKEYRFSKGVFFVLAGGILCAVTIYILFRLLFYSYLLNSTLSCSFEKAKELAPKYGCSLEEELGSYNDFIVCHATENYPFFRDILRHFSTLWPTAISRGSSLSILVGVIINLFILVIYKTDWIDRLLHLLKQKILDDP